MADKDHILIIEDNPQDRELAATVLEHEGYDVTVAETAEKGLELFETIHPSVVLLDLMLPGMDGLDVCRSIRAKHDVPIIMVTAKQEEVDKVVGLELGADDYIAKPYGPRELVARVRAMLRRSVLTEKATAQKRRLSFPMLEVDLPTRTAVVAGEEVHLTPKEFDLLFHLASQPRRVFTRQDIVQDVWGYEPPGGDMRTVDTHIKRLRKKLQEGRDVPWSIATVWGVGYKFETSD